MNSREVRNRFLDITYLLFGGSFPGIALMAISLQFQSCGLFHFITWNCGAALVVLAYLSTGEPKLEKLGTTRGMLVAFVGIIGIIISFLAFALVARGLATLAGGGTYDLNTPKQKYVYAELYLVIATLWLLIGVPHRAFKYRLDQSGEGSAQQVLVGVLVMAASILTGIYFLLLHFGNGPLHAVDIHALIVGIVFTVFLLTPAYRSFAKACWQRGVRGLFSPKRLVGRWSTTLTELDTAFYNAQDHDYFLRHWKPYKVPDYDYLLKRLRPDSVPEKDTDDEADSDPGN